eukprot:TRINITY_DN4905_c1_g1_i2.p1 TRINITY_DN4905_c1_g1~~TRINITY_DN4905_c1_g1_i2.p1  ORF type:complete len:289 (-),score=81.73 TRINITY_DN4905_c1_g1_i2:402-1268(-)
MIKQLLIVLLISLHFQFFNFADFEDCYLQPDCFSCTKKSASCVFCPVNSRCYIDTDPYTCVTAVKEMDACCSVYTGCTECVDNPVCSWCDGKCRARDSNITCIEEYETTEACCIKIGNTSCLNCITLDGCGWCASENECRSREYFTACTKWYETKNDCCGSFPTCDACVVEDDCTYCRIVSECQSKELYGCSDFTQTCGCADDCNGRGACRGDLTCDCDFGYTGVACEQDDFFIQYILSFTFGTIIFAIILFVVVFESYKKFGNFKRQLADAKMQRQQEKLNQEIEQS